MQGKEQKCIKILINEQALFEVNLPAYSLNLRRSLLENQSDVLIHQSTRCFFHKKAFLRPFLLIAADKNVFDR